MAPANLMIGDGMGIGNRLISDRPVLDSIKKFLVDELVGTTIALNVSLSFI